MSQIFTYSEGVVAHDGRIRSRLPWWQCDFLVQPLKFLGKFRLFSGISFQKKTGERKKANGGRCEGFLLLGEATACACVVIRAWMALKKVLHICALDFVCIPMYTY
jgi:hypothetical protein